MTKRQRRTFSSKFKVDAANLVLDHGYSIAEAARSLDVDDSALCRLKIERRGKTPTVKALTSEQQKIQELEARINHLEREETILEKATAFLMSDELEGSH